MKKLFFISTALIFLYSCGSGEGKSVDDLVESKDLSAIRSKRNEILTQQQELDLQLKKIDQALSKLDSVQKLPLVTTINVKDTLFTHYLELQGNVETKQNVVIMPEFSGILTRVLVKEGDQVRKGQILARIDDGGLSQQLAQMEVQAELAKTTFERQKRLWEQKIGSEIQYLQSKTNYEAQQNAVNQMKQQLSKTLVTAPFSGIVDDVITEQGNVVSAAMTPIIRIVNLKDMYIQVEVPERYVEDITKGKMVKVTFPVLNKTIDTKIRQVGNYINPNNRSFLVEVEVPNKEGAIKPNLTAKVQINDYTKENAILIPQSIISENSSGDQYAYVASNLTNGVAEAKKVIVSTGKTQGDNIEILEGIKDGDALISEGARSVRDGQKVEVID